MTIPDTDTTALKAAGKKILVIVGTRPEAIKMAPVIQELKTGTTGVRTLVCSTGQHRELLEQAFSDFALEPDLGLDVMRHNQGLAPLSARLFEALDALYARERPDAILVQGDTTTVQVAATAAFYRHIPVGHVEAGLRSHNLQAPFPEEFNRRVSGLVAQWHFAPTAGARQNLINEGIAREAIVVTGNTVIDALLWMRARQRERVPELPASISAVLEQQRRIILVTGHRRENFGSGFAEILDALKHLAQHHPDIRIIYPVHPNPNVHALVHERLGDNPGIILCEPLAYRQFVFLMDACQLLLTDSGGVQEEGPALGKPVLVTRDVTERPEGVQAGVSILVGPHREAIVRQTELLLTDAEAYRRISHAVNPYGDGNAAWRIVRFLSRELGFPHTNQASYGDELA